MKILGIETSCDDTGIALYDSTYGLIFNEKLSQSYIHNKYGGIVPEIASREHVVNLFTIINKILKKKNFFLKDITAIAYTEGPGLVGSLLVGATFGISLAYSLNIPAIPINHMEAHLLSIMMEEKKCPIFPFLTLLVSGKHTQLIYSKRIGNYFLLGETLDDSAGEAFDKISRKLKLKYPGGPEISKFSKFGIFNKYFFPRPMIHQNNLNFSFSGLKTSVINFINKFSYLSFQNKADISNAFEHAVIDVLVYKCEKAIQEKFLNRLVVAGGVSANILLRKKLKKMLLKYNGKVYFSKPEFCTDNGAMVAYTGMLKFKLNRFKSDLNINVYPKLSICK
ncbi:MAG: tRNA (adenosine(37)-N6)-threonylcarbamoyltransferase complex transferase subunit TsaD [Buchnera aphidicola (Periphyllus aceris)]|nr:tRNA (adenosine(37)-N6)-threonylcarbamoyltransferase complex transferase subunit TsaD [Buchnera aphidicola (Periphyllus aceris)]